MPHPPIRDERIADLEAHAGRLANHIQKIRIDFPEAADARRVELHKVYLQISQLRRSTTPPDLYSEDLW